MNLTLHPGTGLVEMLRICYALPSDEREQWEAFAGRAYDAEAVAAEFHLRPGPKWTIMEGELPVLAAGFTELRDGVWQDWALTTPVAWESRRWMTVTKIVRRVMDGMLQDHGHRLQCVSLASRIQAHRWYRVLGLELEGTLRAYGVHGEDALMFSRLRSTHGR